MKPSFYAAPPEVPIAPIAPITRISRAFLRAGSKPL
jgi:hypothetical protein